MTEKVQKIRNEVEKLKFNLMYGACSSQVAMETRCKEEAYNEVLSIMDSMQKEPKQCMYSKDNYTDEDRKVLCEGCEEKCKFNKKEEPVSEDIQKVGSLKSLEYYPEKKTTNKTSKGVFDANMPRRKAYLRGFKDGAHAHKELIANKPVSGDLEQLMAKAVDATVHIDAGGYPYIPQMELYDYDKDIPLAREGDKYKVILIKEK